MKKILCILLSLVLMFSLCIPAFCEDEVFDEETVKYYQSLGLQGTTLNIYNWGEYIDKDDINVVGSFERLTGCKVNYTTFESNENMYSKLSGGGVSYDVIVPSDYMVEKLLNDGMLLPLDFNNIPNYKTNFDEEDYGYLVEGKIDGKTISDYCVIYNVGTTVLIYNTKYIKEKPDSWSILWDEQYDGKILMFNNPRDSFAIAQAMLGQDFNTTNTDDWDAAAELLRQQREKVHPSYVMDEIFNIMESGDYYLGVYYAGDYEAMKEKNADLDFVYPKEGVNKFYDAMCIPTSAQNKKGAEAFINFMLEPEIALANAEYIYYATANKVVIDSGEFSLADSEAIYPDEEIMAKAQQFHNLPNDSLQYMNTLWMKVKGENNAKGIYIAFFIVLALIVFVIVITMLHKKKMKKYYNV